MNEPTTPGPTDSRDNTPAPPPMRTVPVETRRQFFSQLSLTLAGVCGVVLGAPMAGFVLAPLVRRVPQPWLDIGRVDDFREGETVNVVISDPSPLPWAGITAKNAAWVRRVAGEEFVAFAVNCTHLGCPVRWIPDAQLFMCPCHGGVYYRDGTVAAGPPPYPLFRYDVRVAAGVVRIRSMPVPITTTL